MSRLICLAAVLWVLGSLAPRANADPTVTLSSPADLLQLTVGETVPINVNLQGLPANDFIFVLNTSVLFDSSLFKPIPDPNNSSGLTPGSVFIAQTEKDNFNALSSLTSNSANGNFSDSTPQSSAAIGQNGVYYTFDLQAIAPGSGTIQFNTTGNTYAADDTGFNLAPLPTGPPLLVNISAIPEGSTLSLLVVSGLSLVGLLRFAGTNPNLHRRKRAI